MGRILALDYGRKRIGIAVSDPGKIIAQGLKTVLVKDFWIFLDDYVQKEEIDLFVVGYPVQMNNQPSEALRWINPFIKQLRKKFPEKQIILEDERFTSRMAHQAMIEGGMKKKQRADKMMVDKISATLILQSFMLKKEREK
ncbi:MAG: Holliday junction resolvase RuvX [Chlorobi bacterium]|nr:Holliday junction resolvase RuvX [Chlorobiota bacterium]